MYVCADIVNHLSLGHTVPPAIIGFGFSRIVSTELYYIEVRRSIGCQKNMV
jgi:hypothetical protein